MQDTYKLNVTKGALVLIREGLQHVSFANGLKIHKSIPELCDETDVYILTLSIEQIGILLNDIIGRKSLNEVIVLYDDLRRQIAAQNQLLSDDAKVPGSIRNSDSKTTAINKPVKKEIVEQEVGVNG